MYRLLYKKLSQLKPKIDIRYIHRKKKESKHNTTDSHQVTREENKRRKGKKDLQKRIQNN